MSAPDTSKAFNIPCHCIAHLPDATRPEPASRETFGISWENFSDGSRRHYNKHGHCWIPQHAKDCKQNIAVMKILRPVGADGIRRWWNEKIA